MPSCVTQAVVAALALCTAADALAQLTPRFVYNGVDRPIPFDVEAPQSNTDELTVRLFDALGAEPIDEASVIEGGVDMIGLFPRLRDAEAARTLWAQLYAGEQAIGAPIVLQPMLTQDRAVRSLPNGTVLFESDVREQRRQASGDNTPDPAPVLSGYIAWEDALVVLETSEGPITIRLRPDQAPSTTRHFRDLVEGGFYRDIIFHRVVNELSNGERFVVQVGDPTGTGRGGPGSTVDLEPSKLEHDYGVVSMARSGALDSGGSQFFICLGREGTKSLDGAYTAFGEVIDGRDALEAIALTPVGRGERPLAPPVLKSARTVPAPPRDGTPPARISAPPKDRIER